MRSSPPLEGAIQTLYRCDNLRIADVASNVKAEAGSPVASTSRMRQASVVPILSNASVSLN
jgi:hypothetical protein